MYPYYSLCFCTWSKDIIAFKSSDKEEAFEVLKTFKNCVPMANISDLDR